ncbi:MAG TPA: type II secretion system F family protein [Verrucomicrobiae bacterium]
MPLIITPRQLAQRAELYHQLAQLTSAGMGVVGALEQISRHPPGHSFRAPLQHFLNELAQGKTLSDSLRSIGWLPEFDMALIEAGERSGRLDASFRLLADYYNDRAGVAKQMISQFIYPIALIHLAAVVFLIILPFAASQFHASLLLLFFKAALVLAPIYLATALIIHAMQSKHGEKWRAFIESLLNPIPLLGTARRFLALSRLSAALEALISAGMNIVEAWEIAANASNSPMLRRTVARWKSPLAEGRTPSELVQSSSIFPETFSNLYHSGEISGKLDETLQRLHLYYRDEGTNKLHLVAQWTPRLAYFLIVILIAYEVIQFWTGYFNNIFKITNSF